MNAENTLDEDVFAMTPEQAGEDVHKFFGTTPFCRWIHSNGRIGGWVPKEHAHIPEETRIDPEAMVGPGAQIGEDVRILGNSHILGGTLLNGAVVSNQDVVPLETVEPPSCYTVKSRDRFFRRHKPNLMKR